jgi:uncharacterized protein YuzE
MERAMALYTYDSEADALYVLLVDETDATIAKTLEFSPRLHVDVNGAGKLVGFEVLSPGSGDVDLDPIRTTFGIDVHIPFSFAA